VAWVEARGFVLKKWEGVPNVEELLTYHGHAGVEMRRK
jgi:hypothetical protein